jgi:hypothetical protein
MIGSSPRALDAQCYQAPLLQPFDPPEQVRESGAVDVRVIMKEPPDFDLAVTV